MSSDSTINPTTPSTFPQSASMKNAWKIVGGERYVQELKRSSKGKSRIMQVAILVEKVALGVLSSAAFPILGVAALGFKLASCCFSCCCLSSGERADTDTTNEQLNDDTTTPSAMPPSSSTFDGREDVSRTSLIGEKQLPPFSHPSNPSMALKDTSETEQSRKKNEEIHRFEDQNEKAQLQHQTLLLQLLNEGKIFLFTEYLSQLKQDQQADLINDTKFLDDVNQSFQILIANAFKNNGSNDVAWENLRSLWESFEDLSKSNDQKVLVKVLQIKLRDNIVNDWLTCLSTKATKTEIETIKKLCELPGENKNPHAFWGITIEAFPSTNMPFPWYITQIEFVTFKGKKINRLPRKFEEARNTRLDLESSSIEVLEPARLPYKLKFLFIKSGMRGLDNLPPLELLNMTYFKNSSGSDFEQLNILKNNNKKPSNQFILFFDEKNIPVPPEVGLCGSLLDSIEFDPLRQRVPPTIKDLVGVTLNERMRRHNYLVGKAISILVAPNRTTNTMPSGEMWEWFSNKNQIDLQDAQKTLEKIYSFIDLYHKDPEALHVLLEQSAPDLKDKLNDIFIDLGFLREWMDADLPNKNSIPEIMTLHGLPGDTQFLDRDVQNTIITDLRDITAKLIMNNKVINIDEEEITKQMKIIEEEIAKGNIIVISEVGRDAALQGKQRLSITIPLPPSLMQNYFQAYLLSYYSHPKQGETFQRRALESIANTVFSNDLIAQESDKTQLIAAFCEGKTFNEEKLGFGCCEAINIKTAWYSFERDNFPLAEKKIARSLELWSKGFT